MTIQKFTVNGDPQPSLILQIGLPTDATFYNPSSTVTVNISDTSGGVFFPVPPGTTVTWDAGKALYAQANTTVDIYLVDNGGSINNPAILADLIVDSGLGQSVANALVASALAGNIGAAVPQAGAIGTAVGASVPSASAIGTAVGSSVPVPPSAAAIGTAVGSSVPVPPSAAAIGAAVPSASAIGTAVGGAVPVPPSASAIGTAVGGAVPVPPSASAIGTAVGGAVPVPPSASAIGTAVGGSVPSASAIGTAVGSSVPVPPSAAAIGAAVPSASAIGTAVGGSVPSASSIGTAVGSSVPVPPSAAAIGAAVPQASAIGTAVGGSVPSASSIGSAVGSSVPSASSIGTAVGGSVPSASSIGTAVGGSVPSASAIGTAVGGSVPSASAIGSQTASQVNSLGVPFIDRPTIFTSFTTANPVPIAASNSVYYPGTNSVYDVRTFGTLLINIDMDQAALGNGQSNRMFSIEIEWWGSTTGPTIDSDYYAMYSGKGSIVIPTRGPFCRITITNLSTATRNIDGLFVAGTLNVQQRDASFYPYATGGNGAISAGVTTWGYGMGGVAGSVDPFGATGMTASIASGGGTLQYICPYRPGPARVHPRVSNSITSGAVYFRVATMDGSGFLLYNQLIPANSGIYTPVVDISIPPTPIALQFITTGTQAPTPLAMYMMLEFLS